MSISSIFTPTYTWTYPAPDAYDTYNGMITKAIFALPDENNTSQNLLIGSSSNLNMQAVQNINMYIKDQNKFNIFSTTVYGNNTSNAAILSVGDIGGVTQVNTGASTSILKLSGGDTNATTWVSGLQVRNFNDSLQFATARTDGLLLNNSTVCQSNLNVKGGLLIEKNMEVVGNSLIKGSAIVNGSFCSRNMNVLVSKPEVSLSDNNTANQVGFGFRINSKDQLEIVKYSRFGSNNTINRRVAVFGNRDITPSQSNDGQYLVFDEINGIGMAAESNALGLKEFVGQPLTWKFNTLGDVYTTGRVGVGTSNIEETVALKVNGTLNTSSLLTQGIATGSDSRLKELETAPDTATCLEKVMNLDVVRYHFKNTPDESKTGFIAQQVESIMPDAVQTQNFLGLEDCKLIEPATILAYAVGAIKELAKKLAN